MEPERTQNKYESLVSEIEHVVSQIDNKLVSFLYHNSQVKTSGSGTTSNVPSTSPFENRLKGILRKLEEINADIQL